MDSKKKNVHVCRPCCTVKSWCLIMLDIHHINRLARFGSSTGIQDQLYIELWDKKIISKRSEILMFFLLNSVVNFVNFVSTGRFDPGLQLCRRRFPATTGLPCLGCGNLERCLEMFRSLTCWDFRSKYYVSYVNYVSCWMLMLSIVQWCSWYHWSIHINKCCNIM